MAIKRSKLTSWKIKYRTPRFGGGEVDVESTQALQEKYRLYAGH